MIMNVINASDVIHKSQETISALSVRNIKITIKPIANEITTSNLLSHQYLKIY